MEDYYIVDDFLQYTENCLAYAYKQNDIELVLVSIAIKCMMNIENIE